MIHKMLNDTVSKYRHWKKCKPGVGRSFALMAFFLNQIETHSAIAPKIHFVHIKEMFILQDIRKNEMFKC